MCPLLFLFLGRTRCGQMEICGVSRRTHALAHDIRTLEAVGVLRSSVQACCSPSVAIFRQSCVILTGSARSKDVAQPAATNTREYLRACASACDNFLLSKPGQDSFGSCPSRLSHRNFNLSSQI